MLGLLISLLLLPLRIILFGTSGILWSILGVLGLAVWVLGR